MGNAKAFTINCQGESAQDGPGKEADSRQPTAYSEDSSLAFRFWLLAVDCRLLAVGFFISGEVPTCGKRQKGVQNDCKQQFRQSPVPLRLRTKLI